MDLSLNLILEIVGKTLRHSQSLYAYFTRRNLYAGQEAIVRTGHGTRDWFQIGKGVRQHASKVVLKILQARLQQYVSRELPDGPTCRAERKGGEAQGS